MSNFREMYFEGEIDGKALLDEIDRMRAEADALRADADRWNWIMSNYYGGDLARTQKILGQCWTREQMEAAIDKDLAERNPTAAMGADA